MSGTSEDDPGDSPESQLLSVPEAAQPGDIWRFWAARANRVQQDEVTELTRERAGDSARHLMLRAEDDPEEREREAEKKRRAQLIAEQERRDLIERQDRLLAQIEERQREVEQRRQEIEDRALRLRDGRRVYVDGDRYRDGEGRALTGADEAEADRQHEYKPDASTWRQKQEIDRQAEEARRLKDHVLQDQAGGGALRSRPAA